MLQVRPVATLEELRLIKLLQDQNLKKNLTAEECASQGFVTAEYSLEFLQTMHNECPSIIARYDEHIAGYALVTLRSVAHLHPLLQDLFTTIDRIYYDNRLLVNSNYVVVGQLCVAKEFRGQGLVQLLYHKFRDLLKHEYEYCITDVAESNYRSLKAHLKCGFRVIDQLSYGGTVWNIVLWNWNSDD